MLEKQYWKYSLQAVNLLQNIPPKQRDKRIYNALGTLYLQSGVENPACAAFKEVIKECPLALDAVVSLLRLGVSAKEIQVCSSCNQQLDF